MIVLGIESSCDETGVALYDTERGLLVLTGVVLAAHFWTWIAGIQLTRVANATSVLALGPVLTALGAVIWFVFSLLKRRKEPAHN